MNPKAKGLEHGCNRAKAIVTQEEPQVNYCKTIQLPQRHFVNHDPLSEAKSRLPLYELMQKIGDGAHVRKTGRCPFHDDRTPSFSVYEGRTGGWFWKCHAGCGAGDGVDYLRKRFNLSTGDAIKRYCKLAGVRWNGGVR